MAESKFNILGIVGLIGALLMVVGVFLNWFEVTLPILGQYTYSGWDIYGSDIVSLGSYTLDFNAVTDYTYAPIVALACGVVSLIAMIFPIVMPGKTIGKILGAIGLLLAVVAVVLAFLCYGDLSEFEFNQYGASVSVGIGLWVVVAGGIVTILGGILDLIRKAD